MKKPTPEQGLALENLQLERQYHFIKLIPFKTTRKRDVQEELDSITLSGALYGLNLRTAKGKQAKQCLQRIEQIRSSLPAVQRYTFEQALQKSLCQ